MNEETRAAVERFFRRMLYDDPEDRGKTDDELTEEFLAEMKDVLTRLTPKEAQQFKDLFIKTLMEMRRIYDEARPDEQGRKLPPIGDAFTNGRVTVWSALPFQAYPQAAINAASGATKWLEEQMSEHVYRLSYAFQKESGTTTISLLSPEEERTAQTAREHIWQQVRKMGDLDGDVYLAVIAQLVNSASLRDEKGWTWISATRILDYRGIQPRKERTESGKEYRAGHRQEDIEDIWLCIQRMRNARVTVDQVIFEEPLLGKGKRKATKKVRYARESPLFQFGQVLTKQELWGKAEGMAAPTMEVAWQVQESAWMEPFIQGTNRMTGELLQSCLHYDPHKEKWEKRISQYLMFHLTMNRRSPTITRRIGTLIKELSLEQEIDERNPVRTKDRFEKALDRLRKDAHISQWRYKEDVSLPARKWLPTWLDQDVVFTRPVVINALPSQQNGNIPK